jgi:hypothetical protein
MSRVMTTHCCPLGGFGSTGVSGGIVKRAKLVDENTCPDQASASTVEHEDAK